MNELILNQVAYEIEQCQGEYPAVLLSINGETLRHDDDKHITHQAMIDAGMYTEQAVKAAYLINELFDTVKSNARCAA